MPYVTYNSSQKCVRAYNSVKQPKLLKKSENNAIVIKLYLTRNVCVFSSQ